MAHRGEEGRLGAVGLLGPVECVLVVADIVEDEHGAGKLLADVEHRLRLDLEAARPERRFQHVLAIVADERLQHAVKQGEVIGTVVAGAGYGRAAEQLGSGVVGVVDGAVAVEQHDRVLETLEDGQVLVLLVGQCAVLHGDVVHQRALVLARPLAAKADLDAVVEAIDELTVARQIGVRQFAEVEQVEVGLAVVLHQAEEEAERDAARAMAARDLDTEGGDRVVGVVGRGGQLRRLAVLGERGDERRRHTADGRAPRLSQRRGEWRVAVKLGVVDRPIHQPVLAPGNQIAQLLHGPSRQPVVAPLSSKRPERALDGRLLL